MIMSNNEKTDVTSVGVYRTNRYFNTKIFI